MQLKIDLHVHTTYSSDSVIAPEELAAYAKKRGLNGLAITDHDTIEGAVRIAAEEKDLLIIPGMEIESSDGHVAALNVSKPVPKGLDADETIERIHQAGGIAIACHPVTLFKRSVGKKTHSKFDAIEVINASAIPFRYSVNRCIKIAEELKLGRVAGSDAHYAPEIGYAYAIVESESDVESVIDAIRKRACQPFGNAIPWSMRLTKGFLLMKKRFGQTS